MTNPADMVPFAKTMGIKITEMSKDKIVGEMLVRPDICTAGNGRGTPSIHGGRGNDFCRCAWRFCGFANLPEGSNGTTTSESKTNFLNAAPEGEHPVRRSNAPESGAPAVGLAVAPDARRWHIGGCGYPDADRALIEFTTDSFELRQNCST